MAEVNDRLVVELSANVDKLLAGLKKAGDATSVWGDQAGKTVQSVSASFNGVSFEAAGGKMRQEVLRQIELQHQLDVARAAGDTKNVALLQRQVDLMQKIKQLRSAGLSAADAPIAAEQQVAALAAAAATTQRRKEEAERAEKVRGNPGKALDTVFSRTRVGVLEEGSAKVPLYGAAFEELGVAGLAAAAGVLAVSEALEKAKEAAEYAESVKNLADKLGVTTKDLQEYQFAAVASGVGVDALNSSLEEGNKILGNYQSNIASAKSKKVFDALGITQEEARKAQTITDLLPEIAEKIKGLAPTEQAGIAERLGLTGILPILQKGKEGIDELRAAAEASGAVLDTDLIKKGAEAAEKLKEASAEVDGNMRRAFIALAPFIAACATQVAKIAKAIADALEALGPVANWSRVHVNDEIATSRSVQAFVKDKAGPIDAKTGMATGRDFLGLGPSVGAAVYNNHQRLITEQYQPRLKELDAIDKGVVPPKGKTDQLVADKTPKTPRTRQAPEDKTREFDKAAEDAAAEGQKAYDTALAALTNSIQAHADLEKKAVDDDLGKKLIDTQAKRAEIDDAIAKGHADADVVLQKALLDVADAEQRNAAAAKKELIDRNAEAALRDQSLAQAAELLSYDQRIRSAQASIATSAERRVELELQSFKAEQDQAYGELQGKLQDRVTKGIDPRTGKEGDYTSAMMEAELAKARQTNAVETVAKRQSLVRSADPLYSLANPTTSVDDDLRSAEAKGVDSLGESLKGVALGTKTVSAAFHDMAQSIIGDLAEIAIKRAIEAPLAETLFNVQNPYGSLGRAVGGAPQVDGDDSGDFLDSVLALLPHAASGGLISGPGGPRDDMVPTMLSNGEYVMPAGVTAANRSLLDAIRNGGVPHLADGGLIGSVTRMSTPRMASAAAAMNLTVAVDANGAFSYDHVQEAVRRGVVEAVRTSRGVIPQDLAARQRQQLP